jgi:hypothetical protein
MLIGQSVGVGVVQAAEATDTVVRVQVVDAAGMPVQDARVLTTVLWTSKRDFDLFGHPGGRAGQTDLFGDVAVRLRLSARERAAVARNGDWLNMSIVAIDARGDVIAHTAASRYLGTDQEERLKAGTMARYDSVMLTARSSGSSGSQLATEQWEPGALASCTYYWDAASYALRYAQVGELHVDYDVPFARFTYGRFADTTFDVALKSGGSEWSISGSVHVSNSQDTSVYANAGGQANYHWALRTQFRFVNMRLYKDCLGGPYRAWTGSEEWYALEWTGGGMTLANTLTQPARTAANTSVWGPNTGWSRASSTLTKWSSAVSFFGVTIGAQSGASANVRIEYAFGSRSTHYLYGDTAPPGSSKRVFQDTP